MNAHFPRAASRSCPERFTIPTSAEANPATHPMSALERQNPPCFSTLSAVGHRGAAVAGCGSGFGAIWWSRPWTVSSVSR